MPGQLKIDNVQSPESIKQRLRAGRASAPKDDPLGAKAAGMAGLPAIVTKLVEVGSEIDKIDSPTARAAAKSFYKGLYSDVLGFAVDIPDEQDIELKELRRRDERHRLLQSVAQNDLREARAFLMDDPDIKKRYGDPGEIMKDPESMLSVLQALGVKSITRGTFELAGDELAGKSARDTKRRRAKEQAEDLQRTDSALLNTSQIAEREPMLDKQIRSGLDQAEEAADADLGGMFSDIDEDRGSAALLAAYQGIRSQLGDVLTPSVARRFLAIMAGDISDQLDGLPMNERKELVVGSGDVGVTGIATVNLGELILQLSQDMGVSPTAVMRQLKLPYSGIDLESMRRGRSMIGKEFGETQKKVGRAMRGLSGPEEEDGEIVD